MTTGIDGTTKFLSAGYTDSANSGQWTINADNTGTPSPANTTIAPVANTWTTVAIEVDTSGGSAEFFFDGVSGGTITGNIPNVPVGLAVFINKSVGGTASVLDVDYGDIGIAFTSPR